MEEKSKKSNRGGYRPGAGRKPKTMRYEVIQTGPDLTSEKNEKFDLILNTFNSMFEKLEKKCESIEIENKDLIRENAELKTEIKLIKESLEKKWYHFWK